MLWWPNSKQTIVWTNEKSKQKPEIAIPTHQRNKRAAYTVHTDTPRVGTERERGERKLSRRQKSVSALPCQFILIETLMRLGMDIFKTSVEVSRIYDNDVTLPANPGRSKLKHASLCEFKIVEKHNKGRANVARHKWPHCTIQQNDWQSCIGSMGHGPCRSWYNSKLYFQHLQEYGIPTTGAYSYIPCMGSWMNTLENNTYTIIIFEYKQTFVN